MDREVLVSLLLGFDHLGEGIEILLRLSELCDIPDAFLHDLAYSVVVFLFYSSVPLLSLWQRHIIE